MAKIILAGGSGFIGQYLQQRFEQDGYTVQVISRNARQGHIAWKDRQGMVQALEGAWMVINLAGKPINCRHNAANKKAILDSRVQTTETLNDAIRQCSSAPQYWFNASGAAYYTSSVQQVMTEADHEENPAFMGEVARQWEQALFAHTLPHTRRIAMRIAIVLGKGGGVLQPFRLLTRLGLGGTQGSGKQIVSWIHVEDFYQIIRFIADSGTLDGPINFAAPEPLPNKQFLKTMRSVMHMPIGIPAPELAIRIGGTLIGTEPDLLLDSSYVVSQRLADAGFRFRFAHLRDALTDLL